LSGRYIVYLVLLSSYQVLEPLDVGLIGTKSMQRHFKFRDGDPVLLKLVNAVLQVGSKFAILIDEDLDAVLELDNLRSFVNCYRFFVADVSVLLCLQIQVLLAPGVYFNSKLCDEALILAHINLNDFSAFMRSLANNDL
jgi:hypothetical protein